MPINNLIQFRKGSYSDWYSSNPILASGEPGFDTTNNIFKIGDGTSNWNDLSGIDLDLNLDTGLLAGSGIVFNYDEINNSLTIQMSGVSNFGNNRILTSNGTSTGIVANSGLLFDGSTLQVLTNMSVTGEITATIDGGGVV